jgi:hypothetical protein
MKQWKIIGAAYYGRGPSFVEITKGVARINVRKNQLERHSFVEVPPSSDTSDSELAKQ